MFRCSTVTKVILTVEMETHKEDLGTLDNLLGGDLWRLYPYERDTCVITHVRVEDDWSIQDEKPDE